MKNFTIKELCASSTASRLKINNQPSKEEEARLNELIDSVLQPLRDRYGKPIRVNSGYRCKALNKAVGGVPSSQHLKGEAADITGGNKPENKRLFNLAKQMIDEGVLKVGQLIDEKGYQWIHISLPDRKHLNQILHL